MQKEPIYIYIYVRALGVYDLLHIYDIFITFLLHSFLHFWHYYTIIFALTDIVEFFLILWHNNSTLKRNDCKNG